MQQGKEVREETRTEVRGGDGGRRDYNAYFQFS